MARGRKRASDRGPDARRVHSATINHWVGPTLQDRIVKQAQITLLRARNEDVGSLARARLQGRVDGMAIALAILRQTKAKDELSRIKDSMEGMG